MIFACPTCSQALSVPDGVSGQKVACPKCNQRILVPTPPSRPVGTNKTTLGKIIDPPTTHAPEPPSPPEVEPIPIASAAPSPPPREADDYDERDGRERRPRKKHKPTCRYCKADEPPYFREEISMTGWIIFGVILFVFFPLCWIGLFMKEKVSYCRECHSRLSKKTSPF